MFASYSLYFQIMPKQEMYPKTPFRMASPNYIELEKEIILKFLLRMVHPLIKCTTSVPVHTEGKMSAVNVENLHCQLWPSVSSEMDSGERVYEWSEGEIFS